MLMLFAASSGFARTEAVGVLGSPSPSATKLAAPL